MHDTFLVPGSRDAACFTVADYINTHAQAQDFSLQHDSGRPSARLGSSARHNNIRSQVTGYHDLLQIVSAEKQQDTY